MQLALQRSTLGWLRSEHCSVQPWGGCDLELGSAALASRTHCRSDPEGALGVTGVRAPPRPEGPNKRSRRASLGRAIGVTEDS
eukprot:10171112-Alexandrium_andersonii.AAC.1